MPLETRLDKSSALTFFFAIFFIWDSIIYVDKNTLHLSGPQLKEDGNRHPIQSTLEKAGGSRGSGKWRREFRASGLTKELVEANVDAANVVADTKKDEREGPRRLLTELRRQSTAANHGIKHCSPNDKPSLLAQLKKTQHQLRVAELEFQKLDRAWDEAKKARNYWSRMLTGAKAGGNIKASKSSGGDESQESLTRTKPTWNLPCAEDTPQYLDLGEFFATHRTKTASNRTRIVVP